MKAADGICHGGMNVATKLQETIIEQTMSVLPCKTKIAAENHQELREVSFEIKFRSRGMRFLGLATAALITFELTAAAHANLVTNGDFDNIGSVWVDNTHLGSDDIQTPGGTAPPGWTVVYNNEFWFSSTNSYSGLTSSPGNGSIYAIDLTGQANSKPYGGLQQTIVTTPGQQYVLSFALGSSIYWNNSTTGLAALTASAAGTSQLFTLAPSSDNTWATETLYFTATSSSTTIEFLADSSFTSEYTGLDNVNVSPIPEPSTWAMMIIGFLGLGLLAHRRHKYETASFA
jgi:hypothetical protein